MSKSTKKIIPYLFLLLILVGVFGVGAEKAEARTTPPSPLPQGFNSTLYDDLTDVQQNAYYTNVQSGKSIDEALTVAQTSVQSNVPASSGNALYDSLSSCPPVDGC